MLTDVAGDFHPGVAEMFLQSSPMAGVGFLGLHCQGGIERIDRICMSRRAFPVGILTRSFQGILPHSPNSLGQTVW